MAGSWSDLLAESSLPLKPFPTTSLEQSWSTARRCPSDSDTTFRMLSCQKQCSLLLYSDIKHMAWDLLWIRILLQNRPKHTQQMKNKWRIHDEPKRTLKIGQNPTHMWLQVLRQWTGPVPRINLFMYERRLEMAQCPWRNSIALHCFWSQQNTKLVVGYNVCVIQGCYQLCFDCSANALGCGKLHVHLREGSKQNK